MAHEILNIATRSGYTSDPLFSFYTIRQDVCGECCKYDAKLRCSGCGTPYCDADCQQKSWPKHRKICMPTPQRWAAFIERNAMRIVCSTRFLLVHLHAEHRGDMNNVLKQWHKKSTIDIAGTKAQESNTAQLWTQAHGCREADLSACKTVDGVPALLSKTRRVEVLWALSTAYGHTHGMLSQSGDVPAVAANILYRYTPALDMAVALVRMESCQILADIDAEAKGPTLYHFWLQDRTQCAVDLNAVMVSNPDNYHGQARNLLQSQNTFNHNLLVVCMDQTAFIVQSYYGYYTATQWCAIDKPLAPAPELEFFADLRYPLLPGPGMRGVHERTAFWPMFTAHLDALTATTDATRSYAAITGIQLPKLNTPMKIHVTRFNLQYAG